MGLVRLMQTSAGRTARIVVGVGLMVLGASLDGGWWVLVAVGLVPILAGSAGVCLVAPLFHVPLRSTGRS
jgi:hypothetical protein